MRVSGKHSIGECMIELRHLSAPRNHRIEQAISAAVEASDFTPFETLLDVLARPYDEQPEHSDHAAPAQPAERVRRTFCGT